jgi:hypothetical protein
MAASNSAVDARMMVPQRLPDSPNIVEKSAAPKASANPKMASRNRTQTCEILSCGKRPGAEGGRVWARSEITLLIRLFSGAVGCLCQHMTTGRRVEVTEETLAGEAELAKRN